MENLTTSPFQEQIHREGGSQQAQESLDHAWNWFKMHAEQRITLIRFYLVVFGGVAAGYITLINNGFFFLAGVESCFGAFLSICFNALDARSRNLVKAGEAALIEEQRRIAHLTGISSFNIIVATNGSSSGTLGSYTRVFRAMFIASVITFSIMSLYGFARSSGVRTMLAPIAKSICAIP